MFKLVVLSVLCIVALARASHYDSSVYSVPAYASITVQEPAYAHVGSVVKSVPAAISHHSQSVVHGSAHVTEDVWTPIVKSTAYSTKSLVAPVYKTYAAPTYVNTVAAPYFYKSYVAGSPALYKTW